MWTWSSNIGMDTGLAHSLSSASSFLCYAPLSWYCQLTVWFSKESALMTSFTSISRNTRIHFMKSNQRKKEKGNKAQHVIRKAVNLMWCCCLDVVTTDCFYFSSFVFVWAFIMSSTSLWFCLDKSILPSVFPALPQTQIYSPCCRVGYPTVVFLKDEITSQSNVSLHYVVTA